MAEELGKIEKPSIDEFKGTRKIYIVPLIFAGSESPEEYREKTERYWLHVSEHILAQESKVGKVTRIYHESIALGGEEGLQVMERWNAQSYRIVKQKVDEGAVLEATELPELADECMDWERCLMLGFFSRKVAETVSGHYREAAKKRYEYISQRISDSLQPGDIALLFIREGHEVQFPPDIDVFSIAPPSLDDIHRWLRERSRRAETGEYEEQEGEGQEQ